MGPVKGGALEPYLTLTRMIPTRIRQLHVDLVHERVFMLAYAAHVHYSAVAETVDQCVAPIDDIDPIIPPPSIEEIGKGNKPSFWYVQHPVSRKTVFFTNRVSNPLGIQCLMTSALLDNQA